jgi:mannose-1-phosphate guanylyltransferase
MKKTLLIITLSFLFSCNNLQISKKPTVKLEKFDIKAISLQDITFNFDFKITNPYFVKIKLDDIKLVINIENKKLMTIKTAKGLSINSKSSKNFSTDVVLKHSSILKIVKDYSSKEYLNCKIDINIVLPLPKIPGLKNQSIPFNYTVTKKIPAIKPKIKIANFQVEMPSKKDITDSLKKAGKKIRKTKKIQKMFADIIRGKKPKIVIKPSDLDLKLKIKFDIVLTNDSNFKIKFTKLNYTFNINKTDLINGITNKIKTSGKKSILSVSNEFSSKSIGKSILSAFKKKKGKFLLQGEAKIIPVIMAGGAGTRLWPLSKKEKPKQFHNFSGDGTLMNETIQRLLSLSPDHLVIVTSKNYDKLTARELEEFNIKSSILSEPVAKNTAAAILYSAIYLDKLVDDSTMILLPADHYIKNTTQFIDLLKYATKEAEKDCLVTIGIKPTYPETGYGYIKADINSSGKIKKVDSFVEKPNTETAMKYFKSGNYYWNSGIFIWKTSYILSLFKELMPEHYKAFEPLISLTSEEIKSDSDKIWEIKKSIFNNLESISIDHGILEKAKNRLVIPGDFGWADLGSWKAIDDILPSLENNNRAPEKEKAIFLNSENCTVFSESKRISLLGVSNIVVIESGDEILVLDKNSSQDVKKILELTKK